MKKYYKLVRDNIPDIIADTGAYCETVMLSETDYLHALDDKLNEELQEFLASDNVEELADLLEVIYAAAAARGVTAECLDAIRELKAAERGRFEKRVFLKYVED